MNEYLLTRTGPVLNLIGSSSISKLMTLQETVVTFLRPLLTEEDTLGYHLYRCIFMKKSQRC